MDIVRFSFKTIDSTNTWAKANSRLFEKEALALIIAEEQTEGRGRFKRHWISPREGNIYATFCFFFDPTRKDLGNLPQILALSAVDTLEAFGFQPNLRWPNDLLLNEKKVAGILCETTLEEQGLLIINGIGINVNMPLSYLEEIDRPATSLLVEGGKKLSVREILQALERAFVQNLITFLNEGFAPFYARYVALMGLPKGHVLHFSDDQQIWEGKYDSIQPDGSLVLALKDGTKKTFLTGEFLSLE